MVCRGTRKIAAVRYRARRRLHGLTERRFAARAMIRVPPRVRAQRPTSRVFLQRQGLDRLADNGHGRNRASRPRPMTKRVKSAAAASRHKAGLPFALTRGGTTGQRRIRRRPTSAVWPGVLTHWPSSSPLVLLMEVAMARAVAWHAFKNCCAALFLKQSLKLGLHLVLPGLVALLWCAHAAPCRAGFVGTQGSDCGQTAGKYRFTRSPAHRPRSIRQSPAVAVPPLLSASPLPR